MAAESSTLNKSLRLAQTVTGSNDGGSQIFRHITRKSSVPDIISHGMRNTMSWPEVYSCLIATVQKGTLPIKLAMVDTVQLDRLEVKNSCFRDALGTLTLHPKESLNLTSAYNHIMKISSLLQGDSAINVAVCYKYGSSRAIILDAESFEALCFETITAPSFGPEIQLLQPLIPARGYDDQYRTFHSSYWLESLSSIPQMKTEVNASRAVTRSARIKSQLHRNRTENKVMETIVLQLVNLIETTNCCRVTRAGFDFVQDVHDHIWLLCSTECIVVTSAEGPQKRVLSPGSLKRARASHLAELQRAAKDDLDLRIELEQQRARENNRRRPSTAAGAMSAPATNSHPSSYSHEGIRPNATMKRFEQPMWLRKGGRPRSPNAHVRPVVPEATFGDETAHLPLIATLLGSSQLCGTCPGDFCTYNVDAMNSLAGAVSSSSSTLKMSSFRRKWALLTTEGSVEDVEDEENDEEASIKRKRRRNASMMRRGSTHRTRFIDAAAEAAEAGRVMGESEAACPSLLISYRSILQARQEMPLVRMQLARHGTGGTGEYVNQENLHQMKEVSELSAKMAAIYYSDSPVCASCYKVYTVVDGARHKALKTLAQCKSRPGTAHSPSYAHALALAPAHTHTRTRTLPTGHDIIPDHPTDLSWTVDVIEGITPRDVSDIRRMPSPPAAVEVVVEALLVVLTGRFMSFQEGRRVLLTGDTFLASLKAFRPEALTDSGLQMVETYTDNPLFRPQHLRQINPCAAKFCAWVLGVVQLAKDLRFRRMSRQPSEQGVDTSEQPAQNERSGDNKNNNHNDGNEDSNIAEREKSESGQSDSHSSSHMRVLAEVAHPVHRHQHHLSLPAIAGDATDVDTMERIGGAGGVEFGREGGEGGSDDSRVDQQPESADPTASISAATRTGTFALQTKAASSSTAPIHTATSTAAHAPVHAPVHALSHADKENNFIHPPVGRPRTSATRMGLKPPMSGGPLPPTIPPALILDNSAFAAERQRLVKKAMAASQKRASERLSAMKESLYIPAAAGADKEFRCSDGFTALRYAVAGTFSITSPHCNFVLVHDFFETVDASLLLMRHIALRHEGCQALCFNYPGQSHTSWPLLRGVETERGAVEPVHNNDWLADRLHELLQHVESQGEILLSSPFHLVGMGNGACVAAAFAQRYGSHPSYAHSLRSLVSINGFLHPDPQLRAILHSAAQLCESVAATRPDIPVNFWTRFLFSDGYLKRVPRTLALQAYTAVSNPITAQGRVKIARGALQHRDLRGGLDPRMEGRTIVATTSATATVSTSAEDRLHHVGTDGPVDASASAAATATTTGSDHATATTTGSDHATRSGVVINNFGGVSTVLSLAPVRVPVIVLQSTEDLLVSPTHVDAFVSGRSALHLFSHELNHSAPTPTNPLSIDPSSVRTHWVGKTSTGPHDYARHSSLGLTGLQMLLDTLHNPLAALVVWVKAGHCVQQEARTVLLDVLDALASPTIDHVGDIFLKGRCVGAAGAAGAAGGAVLVVGGSGPTVVAGSEVARAELPSAKGDPAGGEEG